MINLTKKKKSLVWSLLGFIAIVAMIIAIMEGYIYYSITESNIYVQILMNLHNVIKTFLSQPVITISNAKSLIEVGNLNTLEVTVGYLYMIAVVVAPLCTTVAIVNAVESSFRKLSNKYSGLTKKKVYIFGYNDNSKILINNLIKNNKVYLMTNIDLSSDEKIELYKLGLIIYKVDLSNENADETDRNLRKIKIAKADAIILFENNSSTNFSIFLNITEFFDKKKYSSGVLKKTIVCSISCEDDETRELITNYYKVEYLGIDYYKKKTENQDKTESEYIAEQNRNNRRIHLDM